LNPIYYSLQRVHVYIVITNYIPVSILASNDVFFLCSFSTLHRKDAGNYDVFKHSVEPLLDLYMAGFNVCLLIMGESEAGKTFTMAGETANKAGVVPMILDYLFTRLTEGSYLILSFLSAYFI